MFPHELLALRETTEIFFMSKSITSPNVLRFYGIIVNDWTHSF